MTSRKVLVTGASRGIGRAIALELASLGHVVAIHYGKSEAEAAEVQSEIQSAGGQALLVQGDLSSLEGAKAVAEQAVKELGGLEVLVNNAGITKDGLVMRMKDEDWASVIDTNLTSSFGLIRAAIRSMVSAKWGRIINISSVAGLVGQSGQANYAASKAGLLGLTKSIAKEYGSKNITCNAVVPGFITTDMTAKLPDELKIRCQKQLL